MKKQREFLYNDETTFNYFKGREAEAIQIFENIEASVKKAIGNTEINYIQLFNDASHLADIYVKKYRSNAPVHLDKNVLLKNDTKVDLNELKALLTHFNKVNDKLHNYKLKVVKNGIKSTLKKEAFDKYLNEELRQKYEALEIFLNASKELKKYYNVPVHNLCKCAEDLIMEGLEVKMQLSKFSL